MFSQKVTHSIRDISSIKFFRIYKGRQKPGSTFRVHMGNSTEWVKGGIEIRAASVFRLPHASHSPSIIPCDFWLFGLLKGIMKDREFHCHEESEEAIPVAWNDLTFEDVQSIFYGWMRRLA
jgi:hypothetical protein